MAEIKKDEQKVPSIPKSRWQIQNLGGNMMFIKDPDKQAGANGKPFGWVMSEKEAFSKFSGIGKNITDPDDLDLQNSVMSYLATKDAAPQPKSVGGRPKGATGTAKSDADRAREYRRRKREAKIKAEMEAKKGI